MDQHEFIDSKFRLVILAAKRARQLLRGARKKIDMEAENSLTIALEEINRGLINFEITDGTPREPDLSIFGDSSETEAAEGIEEADLDGEVAEADPEEESENLEEDSEPEDKAPAPASEIPASEEPESTEEAEETQPAAE